MKVFFFLLVILSQSVFAQSTRPNTPYWKLVAEIEKTGLNAFARYDWTERSLDKLLYNVPTIRALEIEVTRRRIVYKMGGENPGKNGFATLLKNGDIYIQVYYTKALKNIDVALTLGHELVHAYHIDSGLHDSWKTNVRVNQKEYAECISETGAYTWSSIYADNASTRKWITEQIQSYQACVKRLSR